MEEGEEAVEEGGGLELEPELLEELESGDAVEEGGGLELELELLDELESGDAVEEGGGLELEPELLEELESAGDADEEVDGLELEAELLVELNEDANRLGGGVKIKALLDVLVELDELPEPRGVIFVPLAFREEFELSKELEANDVDEEVDELKLEAELELFGELE